MAKTMVYQIDEESYSKAFIILDEIGDKAKSLDREHENIGAIIGVLVDSLKDELRRTKQIEVEDLF